MGHGIVPDEASWSTFIWVLAAFIIATIAFALSLQFVIERLRGLGRFAHRVFVARRPARLAPPLAGVRRHILPAARAARLEALLVMAREYPAALRRRGGRPAAMGVDPERGAALGG